MVVTCSALRPSSQATDPVRLVRAFGYLLTRGSIFKGCTPTAYTPPLQVLRCLRPSSGGRDSNSQPSVSETDALTIELRPVVQAFGLRLLTTPVFPRCQPNQPMKRCSSFRAVSILWESHNILQISLHSLAVCLFGRLKRPFRSHRLVSCVLCA